MERGVFSVQHTHVPWGKGRAQEITTILSFFLFFLVAILGIKPKVFHIPDKCFTTKLSQARLFNFASNYSFSLEYGLDGEDSSGMVSTPCITSDLFTLPEPRPLTHSHKHTLGPSRRIGSQDFGFHLLGRKEER